MENWAIVWAFMIMRYWAIRIPNVGLDFLVGPLNKTMYRPGHNFHVLGFDFLVDFRPMDWALGLHKPSLG